MRSWNVFLFTVLALGGAVAACSSDSSSSNGDTTPIPSHGGGDGDDAGAQPAEKDAAPPAIDSGANKPADAGKPFSMKPIVASKLGADLAKVGLDIANLPAIDDVADQADHTQLKAVMHSFRDALGIECKDCHTAKKADGGTDFEADPPTKLVAENMWGHFLRDLKFADGSPFYCDSCHQGKKEFLDRSDHKGLAHWMHDNFVGKLARKDGKPMDCETCHGDPFNPSFLDDWKKK